MNTQKIRMAVMLLLCVLLAPLSLQAQNVTVHPGNGNMLPALKSGEEDTFFGWDGFATWKHEQLGLTLTTGDSDNNSGTDADGNLARPANDIFASADGTCLQIGKGNSLNTYLTVSLPKGYRFTGYTITFHRISSPNGASGSVNNYNGNISFGETNDAFTYRTTTNTTTQNITTYGGGIGQNNTTQYTIGRTSQTNTDMANVLYFMLSNGAQSGRAFIQLDRVEFYFTAENNYTPLIPAPNVTERSAVDIPFTTSKMDYGELKRYNISGQEVTSGGRISYNGTIHDMNANLTLYEDGSVEAVTDNGFDGTAGNIVKYQSGSISQAGDYFKLDASKHGNLTTTNEAIYYIESPIWAVNSASANANKNPIGYRIIGADFDYTGGNLKFPAVFKIQYESTGHGADQDGTYGLNFYNNSLAYNWNYQTEWRIDDDGYIYVGNTYLRVTTTGLLNPTPSGITTTTNKSQATPFIITNNNQIRMKNNTNYYIGWNESGRTNITRSVTITTGNQRATYTELSHAFSENIGQYTFNIYDKTGTRVEKTVTVNGNSGTLSIDGLNNDAVKIGVIGTGIIKGHIILQALDPYIDRLDIVCQEDGNANGGKLTQQFNATDFAVRGGKFTFYVPENFEFPVKFTFENLFSQYGDETYYGNTSSKNHARYFFMGSTYGDSNANVYNRSESAPYTTKVACLKPGDKKFTFNNAATATATTGSQYEEYPFSKALYASKVNGSFNDFVFSQAEMTNGTSKTAYLFTCDETRYNIAPTTATQHVYYAFYEMTIDMKKKTYQPVFAWEKVYDKTFYDVNKEDAMWGLKITTESVTDDQGTHSGYVTVSQIKDQLTNAMTGTNAPSSKDQILYIDGSNLMSIVENQTTTSGGTTTHTVSELKDGLAKNALIYLPYGSKPNNDNFAYNTIAQYGQTPNFRAASNIVVTDKHPFFTKYDIQVDGANYAKYIREKSKSSYSTVNTATVILPFQILVENGQHNNTYGGSTLKLHQMQNNSSITTAADGKPWAYFPQTYADVTATTDAYKPFLVEVVQNADTLQAGSFEILQKGSTVYKTPESQTVGDYKYLYVGESATGTVKAGEGGPDAETAGTFTFTNYGTIAGIEIPKADAVFYFAQGRFLNSSTLASSIQTVKILPFRSFYTTSPTANTAKFSTLDIILGEGMGDEPDAIRDLRVKEADLAVQADHGTLTIASKADNNVRVSGVNGISRYNFNMKAGDVKTVNVPAGVYIVNGVKILVK
ncbi:MAG: hypothetical protein J6Y04_00250 [Bacteroidaceae bacterium]|nr:hypothetical protein [Bacteroidaceae bacterium]